MKLLSRRALATLSTAELFAAREFMEFKATDLEVALSNCLAPASMEQHMREDMATLDYNMETITSILEAR